MVRRRDGWAGGRSAPLVGLLAASVLGVLGAAACRGGPEVASDPAWLPGSAEVALPLRPFSGRSAAEAARELARLGAEPRSDARLREWIEAELRALGASAPRGAAPGRDAAAPPGAVIGTLPGRSADTIWLAAAYGEAPAAGAGTVERWRAASGPAVLLELARALAARPRAYTIGLAIFPAAWARSFPTDAGGAVPSSGARERLTVCFESLADPDLRVQRDLASHRLYREVFWDSAHSLALEDVFAPDAPLRSPAGFHHTLLARGVRNLVALVGAPPDERIGRITAPAAPAAPAEKAEKAEKVADETAELTAVALRLDELGIVVLDALDVLSTRLARIDDFARDPLAAEHGDPPVSPSEPAAGDGTVAPGAPAGR